MNRLTRLFLIAALVLIVPLVASAGVGSRAKLNADSLIADAFAKSSAQEKALSAFCGASKRELNVNVLADRELIRVLPAALTSLGLSVKQATGIYTK